MARLALTPRSALTHAGLLVGAVASAFPFYWMLTTSVKSLREASRTPPTLWPQEWHPENYVEAWRMAGAGLPLGFGQYFLNTALVAGTVTLGVIVTSALAGYAFGRLRFCLKEPLFVLLLATMMVPFEVTLIPNFLIVRALGWYNTPLALTVPWLASVFGIFLLRQFYAAIPNELWEATRLDGGGHTSFLWHVATPLAAPALTAVALFSFLASWNSLLWPLIVTDRKELRLIQVAMASFNNEAGSYYQLAMAAATLTIAPIILLFLAAQRQFIEGIARTGLKG